jgi:hypothetical protein
LFQRLAELPPPEKQPVLYAPEQTPDRWRCKLFPRVLGGLAGTLKAFEGWGNVHSIWTLEMDDLVAKQQIALS